MIKINLLAERKPAKARKSSAGLVGEGISGPRSALLIVILLAGAGATGAWWWSLSSTESHWQSEIEKADQGSE